MFRRVHDLKNQLEPSNYFSSLDGYRLEERHEVGSQQYKLTHLVGSNFSSPTCHTRKQHTIHNDLIYLKDLMVQLNLNVKHVYYILSNLKYSYKL